MIKSEASKMTRDLLNQFGLEHVEVVFNPRLTRTFGRYSWNRLTGRRVIELSSRMVEINSEERVMRTIRHEVAHALTEGHGHDNVWKRKCLEIGGDGQARYTTVDTNTIERVRSARLYTLRCEKCGYTGGRYRRRMTGYYHKRCMGQLTSIELS